MLRPILIAVLAVPAFGQTPASAPESPGVVARFQVAAIKPSRPEESRTMQIRGNRFVTTGTSLLDLLVYAYGLHEQQIAGGPGWLKTQKFDLVGDPETESRPSSDEFKSMVQNLLVDRFDLTAHYEMKNLSVFEIVPARTGPQLTRSTRPPNAIPGVGYSLGQLSVKNATLADFATFLQRFVTDRPVRDGTGIAGKYDLTLRWNPDELQTEEGRERNGDRSSLPGLFTAIQEQLGLKLQEEKRPAQVLVVDQVEMPSEN